MCFPLQLCHLHACACVTLKFNPCRVSNDCMCSLSYFSLQGKVHPIICCCDPTYTSPVPHLTLSTHAATVHKCEAHAAHLELSDAYFASFHSPFAVFSTSVGGCMLLYYHSNYCMCSSHAGLLGRGVSQSVLDVVRHFLYSETDRITCYSGKE